jgi:hypothetical protein
MKHQQTTGILTVLGSPAERMLCHSAIEVVADGVTMI